MGWHVERKAAELVVQAVEEFKKAVSKSSQTMIEAVKDFDKSSTRLAGQMLKLSKTMTYLTVAILLVTMLTLGFFVIQLIFSNEELINALRFSP